MTMTLCGQLTNILGSVAVGLISPAYESNDIGSNILDADGCQA